MSAVDSRPPAQVIIGLDVGTTATKAAAFGVDRPWTRNVSYGYPLLEPEPGWQVQRPAAVHDAVIAALRDIVRASEGAEVVAIALSTAWHGLVGLDADGEPITDIVTWADARATSTLAGLHADGDVRWLHQLTGTPVHPMSPLLKLRWFAANDPQLAGRVRWWVGLKDLVVHQLTGQIVTELSTASGSGMLNRWTQEWSPQAAAIAKVDLEALPPILAPSDAIGLLASVADRVGLPAGLPVVLGAADGPLGNVGAGAIGPGVAGLSLGTSGAVRVLVHEQPANLDPALFCYSLDADTWVVGGAISNGGIVVRWLADLLIEPGSLAPEAAVLDLAARAPAGSDGLVMLPYLLAERAPLWDPTTPGAILGLRRRHGRMHIARAGIEGVAIQLGVIADRLATLTPITSVRATGGAFVAPLWGTIIASALGRGLVVGHSTAGTALGAAALGAAALGLAPDLISARATLLGSDTGESTQSMPDPAWTPIYARMRDAAPRVIEAMQAMTSELLEEERRT